MKRNNSIDYLVQREHGLSENSDTDIDAQQLKYYWYEIFQIQKCLFG